MTGSSSAPTLRIERFIAAPPDRVFAAWMDPDLLGRWMSPIGHATAEIEPWVGGRLRVTMVGGDTRIEHRGEYRELVPGRRLVFTWESPYTGPGPSLVTVELKPSGDGTTVVLVHARLPADQVESHRNGWGSMLDRLDVIMTTVQENGGPG